MGSNILNLEFRRAVPLSLSTAIKAYITTKYDQHPDMFAADLEAIEALRTQAVHATEPHIAFVPKLQAYAAQLVWMGGKFPIDIGADFLWYPSLGYDVNTPMSANNITFELANIIFNLGVLYSQLAYHASRTSADGLKNASNYYCLAAGMFRHLRDEVVPELRSTAPEDMDPLTLESVEFLMLAQAQECFWQKAVKDGMKDATISKLAAKVSDLYLSAAEYGVKSSAIMSEWIHHMYAKHHHFAAAAQYRAACDCLEKRKYGEEVARLQDALNCITVGLKEGRYVSKTVIADMNGLKTRCEEDLKRAEKDNDMIYLQPVPTKSELKTLDRASMVSAKVPEEVADPVSMLGENGPLGKPLFSKLVPYSVHVAASIYVGRRDDTINSIANELETLTGRIHELLRSLNLPGSLQALEKPLGLPPGLVSHAEEIRQQNGPVRLRRTMEDIDKLKNTDLRTFHEGIQLLETEATEDQQLRLRYGTERWTRAPSPLAGKHLVDQVKEIEAYFSSAASSDDTIRASAQQHMPTIKTLNGTDRDLEECVPRSSRAGPSMSPRVEREATRLRATLNDVSRMETRRKRKIETLKAKAQADDVNPELLKEASRLEREYPLQQVQAGQFEEFFDKRLERYASDKEQPAQERKEQEKLLSALAEANTAFNNARRGDASSASHEREAALQKLENGYFAYKEIVQNLEVGRKFYNDLAPIVSKFRDACRKFVYERRSEGAGMEADITTSVGMSAGMERLSLQQQQKASHSGRNLRSGAAGGGASGGATRAAEQQALESPIAAPVPVNPVTNVWTPERGIAFGNTEAGKKGGGTWDEAKGIRFG